MCLCSTSENEKQKFWEYGSRAQCDIGWRRERDCKRMPKLIHKEE